MRIDWKFLHNKVALRIFILFILCALLPALTLSVVSYTLVVNQLNRQAEERLHQTSKDTALALFERLQFLEAQMKVVAYKLGSEPGPTPENFRNVLNDYFNGLTVIDDSGRPVSVFGPVLNLPKLSPPEENHILSGKTLVSVRDSGRVPLPILMVRKLERHHSKRSYLLAEANPSYIWGNFENSGRQTVVQVYYQTPSGVAPIYSPLRLDTIPEAAASRMAQSSSGRFQWSYENADEYMTGYWAIFLKSNFYIPRWTVAVSESKDDVLAPIIHFKKTFFLVFLITLWVVLLLSISQIRRSLGPIEKLKVATRRIADGDFRAGVTITSGDEFEELATSFNAMAGQLEKQFRALSGAGNIARAILSTLDTRHIVESVLTGMKEIISCDWVMVNLLDSKNPVITRAFIRSSGAVTGELETAVRIPPGEAAKLGLSSVTMVDASDPNRPSYLAPLIQRGMKSFLILPVFLKENLAAIITLGHSRRPNYDPDDLRHICQLVDQVAVALSNARMVEQIHVLAYYDGLTGLPNRGMFKEQLSQQLQTAKRHKNLVAILFLDLDNFKRINDTLGHDLGDKLLREVTNRLMKWIRPSDYASRPNIENTVVSRLGGDEFTLFLAEIAEVRDAAKVAQRILEVLSKPFMLDTYEVFITASIGITVFPFDGEDGDTLLKNADTAMYYAKDRGRNNYQFFTPTMNTTIMERLSLENDLRKALDHQEFVLHYQPQMDLRTGRVIGMEALLRWFHPTRGLILPTDFIPLAEETGLIVPIGQWVLKTACDQNKALQAAGYPPIRVAVNLSGRQVLDTQLPETVGQILKETGLSPQYLEVEFTESILMKNEKTILNTMHRLKEMGIRLLIDDFGTGYSSLSYLKSFPLDTLKIDKSFVDHIPKNPDDVALIRAIIAMAHSLKLRVLAEGVEWKDQLAFLREESCDEIQGHLFSPPVAVDAIEVLLRERKPPV